ncbi:MAG: serine hydrolase [Phycisphaerales bacterium]
MQRPHSAARRLRRFAAAGLAAVVSLGATSLAAAVNEHDDSSTPTGWWQLTNASPETIDDRIDQGYRIIDLEVNQTAPLRMAATFVRNTGEYASGWWWKYGQTAQQTADFISDNNARLIDLEIYRVNGQKRYAFVAIPNTGDDQTGWWYYSDVSFNFLMDKTDDNNARLVDVDTYVVGGQRVFSGIMIRNTGDFAKNWWIYSNVTAETVSEKISQHNARIVDIEDRGPGKYTVVLNQREGESFWWYHGMTAAQMFDRTDQNGARITDIERYTLNGQTRYMMSMIDNSNALTGRIRRELRDQREGGHYGFRFERVGGGTRASLMGDHVFYPASSVKVLPHVHAMRQVESNPFVTLNSLLNVYGGSDSCDNNHAGQTPIATEPLHQVLRSMMENSSNTRTNAVIDRFGLGNIQNTIDFYNDAGDDLRLEHKLGCGGPSNNPANGMTVIEINRLFERIAQGQVFQQTGTRDAFYDLMSNNRWFASVVEDEAPAGMSDDEIDDFIAGCESASKGGSYTLGGERWRTLVGWFSLPGIQCEGGTERQYVFSLFVDEATALDAGFSLGDVAREMVRDEIRNVLAIEHACPACPADVNGNGVVDTLDMLSVLADFGVCGGCDADIDGNGFVDTGDLLAVLAAWGNCPDA